jgi:hypothetical protein
LKNNQLFHIPQNNLEKYSLKCGGSSILSLTAVSNMQNILTGLNLFPKVTSLKLEQQNSYSKIHDIMHFMKPPLFIEVIEVLVVIPRDKPIQSLGNKG